jgi:hypothetical protein
MARLSFVSEPVSDFEVVSHACAPIDRTGKQWRDDSDIPARLILGGWIAVWGSIGLGCNVRNGLDREECVVDGMLATVYAPCLIQSQTTPRFRCWRRWHQYARNEDRIA